MSKPKSRLRNVRVVEISLVDRPAVPAATIALCKSNEPLLGKLLAGCETLGSGPTNRTAPVPSTKADLADLCARTDALADQIGAMTGRLLPWRVEESPLVKAAKAAAVAWGRACLDTSTN